MVMDSTDQLESDSDCELESDSLLLPDVDPDRDLPLLELSSGRGANGNRIPEPDPDPERRKQQLFNFHPPAFLHLRWWLVIYWFLLQFSFIGTNLIHIDGKEMFLTREQAAARGTSQLVPDSTRIRIAVISAVRVCAALALAIWIMLRFHRNQLVKSCFGPNAALSPGRNWSSPWEVHREFRDVLTMPYSLTSWHIIGCVVCIVLQPLPPLLPYWMVNDVGTFLTFHNQLIVFHFELVVGVSVFTFLLARAPSKKYLREGRNLILAHEALMPGVKEQYDAMRNRVAERMESKPLRQRCSSFFLFASLGAPLMCLFALAESCFWYPDPLWDKNNHDQFVQYDSCADMLRHNAVYATFVLIAFSVAWFCIFAGPVRSVYTVWNTPLIFSEVLSHCQTELLCDCISANSEAVVEAAHTLACWAAARHLLQRLVVTPALNIGNHLVCMCALASIGPLIAVLTYTFRENNAFSFQWWFIGSLALTPLPIALVVWRRALKLCYEATKQIGRFEQAILYLRCRPQDNGSAVETLQAALDTLKAQDIKPRIFWISVSPWSAGSLVGVPSLITGIYALVQRFKHD
eukprot:m.264757 g.264757  ORF g.264757 m.264757 type:complete len:576 (+) comp22777_c0_seq3:129-1856(+)